MCHHLLVYFKKTTSTPLLDSEFTNETQLKFCEKFDKITEKLPLKFLKNLCGMFGKMLFAKFSSEIVLKVLRLKLVEKI